MSLDERMANFKFLYDNDGPHLNPHILEKLKPEQSNVMDQETKSRLSPELPSSLLGAVGDPAAAPQSHNNTSAETKTQAPRTKAKLGEWQKRGQGHRNSSSPRKKINKTVSSKEICELLPASQVLNSLLSRLLTSNVLRLTSELQTSLHCLIRRMPAPLHQIYKLNQLDLRRTREDPNRLSRPQRL